MEIKEIKELIQAVSEHGLTSFKLEEGNLKLSIKKEKQVQQTSMLSVTSTEQAKVHTDANIAEPVQSVPQSPEIIDSDKVIVSPLVGIFYNSASPDSEAFVKVGDSVKKGQTLGLIEAMKLMNEIECEFDGVVEAILAANEDVVEYGQPLFRIR